jgi:hypothetical protein
MTHDQAINILNNPKSTKAALKHALSFALGVEYEPDTKEKQQTVFNRCQQMFCDYYTKETGLTYIFEGKEGKALKELINKVSGLIYPPTDDNVVDSFTAMIQNLPDWYKQNQFSLPVINKKFNEIIASINKNGKGKQQSGISQSYKDRIRNGL